MTFKTLVLSSALVLATMAGARADGTVEVLHWWTSGGEAKALDQLRQDVQAKGVKWVDQPVAGGGGGAAMTVLRARVTAGDPPTASQMSGFDVQDWAAQGVTADLTSIAEANGWDKVIPAALQRFAKYDGKWVAAPINVHSTNWVWANKAVFDKLGLTPPTTFDELIADLDKIKAAGLIPIAQGGQAWQEAVMFDGIVLSTGGPAFYKKAFVDLDMTALGSDTMKTSFDRLAKLSTYVDKNSPGRDWNLATAMVIRGDAGMQFMGDWAKGEFATAGKKPGVDYLCFRFPGTQGDVTFNADLFTFFKVSADRTAAQDIMAEAIENPSLQARFNIIKGSAPARTDVSDANFDACGKKAIADLNEANQKGTLIGSYAQGFGAPAAIEHVGYDVVDKVFNHQIDSAEAVKELVDGIKNAQ
jgi:glucose/mannose transport system substrate-binding protein